VKPKANKNSTNPNCVVYKYGLLIKLDIPVNLGWLAWECKDYSGFLVHPAEVTATIINYKDDIDLETNLDQVNNSW